MPPTSGKKHKVRFPLCQPLYHETYLQALQRQRDTFLHYQHIDNAFPFVDDTPPKHTLNVRLKLKKLLAEGQRLAAIERDNRHLLERIVQKMKGPATVDHYHKGWRPRPNFSLGYEARLRDVKRINVENKNMLDRILATETSYNHLKMELEFQYIRRSRKGRKEVYREWDRLAEQRRKQIIRGWVKRDPRSNEAERRAQYAEQHRGCFPEYFGHSLLPLPVPPSSRCPPGADPVSHEQCHAEPPSPLPAVRVGKRSPSPGGAHVYLTRSTRLRGEAARARAEAWDGPPPWERSPRSRSQSPKRGDEGDANRSASPSPRVDSSHMAQQLFRAPPKTDVFIGSPVVTPLPPITSSPSTRRAPRRFAARAPEAVSPEKSTEDLITADKKTPDTEVANKEREAMERGAEDEKGEDLEIQTWGKKASAEDDLHKEASVKDDSENEASVKDDSENEASVKDDSEDEASVKDDPEDEASVKDDSENEASLKDESEALFVKGDSEKEASSVKDGSKEEALLVKEALELEASVKEDPEKDSYEDDAGEKHTNATSSETTEASPETADQNTSASALSSVEVPEQEGTADGGVHKTYFTKREETDDTGAQETDSTPACQSSEVDPPTDSSGDSLSTSVRAMMVRTRGDGLHTFTSPSSSTGKASEELTTPAPDSEVEEVEEVVAEEEREQEEIEEEKEDSDEAAEEEEVEEVEEVEFALESSEAGTVGEEDIPVVDQFLEQDDLNTSENASTSTETPQPAASSRSHTHPHPHSRPGSLPSQPPDGQSVTSADSSNTSYDVEDLPTSAMFGEVSTKPRQSSSENRADAYSHVATPSQEGSSPRE